MASDDYQRLGFEAQNRAARATDHALKEGFQLLAQGWFALADQTEWLERRFRDLVAERAGESPGGQGD
jgi:hypothetical protein